MVRGFLERLDVDDDAKERNASDFQPEAVAGFPASGC
jgi:hypothetical protein